MSIDMATVVDDQALAESLTGDTVQDEPSRMGRSDAIGIFLSVLCAIHCAVTPVLIAALPSLGLAWFEAPWVHQAMFAGCFLLAGNAVLRGYRVHRRSLVPSVAFGGLGLLAASAFVFPAPCCAAASVGDENRASEASCQGCGHCVAHAASNNDAVVNDTTANGSTVSGSTVNDSIVTSAAPSTGASPSAAISTSWAEWSLSEWWLRLMTPIGGLLLVVAHSLNIKWVQSCRCQCCPA